MIHEDLKAKLCKIISANRRPPREITYESFESNLEEYLQAEVRKTPYGSCLVRHDYYPNGHRHGISDIHSFLNFHPDVVAKLMGNISSRVKFGALRRGMRKSGHTRNLCLDPAFTVIPLDKYLFLDIEATGLSGGVGVFPFLIGTGFFKADDFHIYQLFMRDYHEEQAVLYLLSKIIKDEDLKGLITYNGKSYDTNILNSRSITSGIELPISNMPNFDLLFPVRRIFKKRIGDCSLTSIEREVLHFYRVDDIPGYKVPEIYFDFVRRGFSEPMRKVFIHNLYDVLSMTALAERLCALYCEPLECLHEHDDLFQVAKLYEKSGAISDAMSIFNYLTTHESPSNYHANMAISFVLKKKGDYKEASKIWEKCIDIYPKVSIVPYIELAKYYEHRSKDFKKALEYTKAGLALANLFNSYRFSLQEFDKRINRLYNKIARLKDVNDKKP